MSTVNSSKTVKTTDATGDNYWRVPCNSNPIPTMELTEIPSDWVRITQQEHLDNIRPCINATILRIYCTA